MTTAITNGNEPAMSTLAQAALRALARSRDTLDKRALQSVLDAYRWTEIAAALEELVDAGKAEMVDSGWRVIADDGDAEPPEVEEEEALRSHYDNKGDLLAAVIDDCHRRWLKWTGREWTDEVAAEFADHVPAARDDEACDVAGGLLAALRRALDLYERDATGAGHAEARLRLFVRERLARLMDDGIARRSDDGMPAVLVALEQIAGIHDGWNGGIRARVVTLLGDSIGTPTDPRGHWRHFGFTHRPTAGEMAVAVILLGEAQPIDTVRLRHGMSTSEVIALESDRVRAQKSRMSASMEEREKKLLHARGK